MSNRVNILVASQYVDKKLCTKPGGLSDLFLSLLLLESLLKNTVQ